MECKGVNEKIENEKYEHVTKPEKKSKRILPKWILEGEDNKKKITPQAEKKQSKEKNEK